MKTQWKWIIVPSVSSADVQVGNLGSTYSASLTRIQFPDVCETLRLRNFFTISRAKFYDDNIQWVNPAWTRTLSTCRHGASFCSWWNVNLPSCNVSRRELSTGCWASRNVVTHRAVSGTYPGVERYVRCGMVNKALTWSLWHLCNVCPFHGFREVMCEKQSGPLLPNFARWLRESAWLDERSSIEHIICCEIGYPCPLCKRLGIRWRHSCTWPRKTKHVLLHDVASPPWGVAVSSAAGVAV